MSKVVQVSDYVADVTNEVSAWPGISVHPARFGGTAFRFGSAEVGHVHNGGAVHIPFPRPVRDELLAQGLAEEHPWAPDTGNVSFRISTEDDARHAIWLMRASYLRYALKKAADARQLLSQESERLNLNPRLRTLLEPFARSHS